MLHVITQIKKTRVLLHFNTFTHAEHKIHAQKRSGKLILVFYDVIRTCNTYVTRFIKRKQKLQVKKPKQKCYITILATTMVMR